MFSMQHFIMATLRRMREAEPEYRVRQLALTWYDRDKLTDEDLAEIDGWYPAEANEDDAGNEEDAVADE